MPQDAAKVQMSQPLAGAVAQFNHGCALLEQYDFVAAAGAFEKVLEVMPDWTAARFNLGLAYLNLQEAAGAKDNLSKAQHAFETVLAADAGSLYAGFCLGLLHQHLGDNARAMACYRAVYQADSSDPYVAYKYAEALLALEKKDEGTAVLEKVVAADPGFISGVYRLAAQYQRSGQRDKAKALFERFNALKSSELTGGTFTVDRPYGSAGKYYMALGADNLPLSATVSAGAQVVFSPDVKRFGTAIPSRACPGGRIEVAGMAVADVDGDADLDLCIAGMGKQGEATIWLNDGMGVLTQGQSFGRQAVAPCFGDVDNDGDPDLWLGCVGPGVYFENDGKGKFTAGSPDLAGGDLITRSAQLADVDGDGDLDLLAFRVRQGSVPARGGFEPAANSVFNNNRDGDFPDIAEKLGLALADAAVTTAVFDDFDNDRDLDMVLFLGDRPAIGWVNDRGWAHHLISGDALGIGAADVVAATSGDPDKDGDRDILVFSDTGVDLYVNQGGFRFTKDEAFARRHGRLGGTGGQFIDIDNDGDLDIVIGDTRRPDGKRGPAVLVNTWPDAGFADAALADPGNLLAAITFKAGAACAAADFTGDGRCDILLIPTGETPMLLENLTAGGGWIAIDLVGTREQDQKSRSNYSGIAARVEVKTGNIYQQFVVAGPCGAASMAPLRVHAGLGPYTKVDWLRVIWPDGVLQAEVEVPGGQVLVLQEVQRKTSSCPHLFAWTGGQFEFVADFGGVGGLGYLAEPGVYARPDPTEYLPLPDLAPLQGKYVLQVLEPLEEAVYVDEVKLLAVDHPAGTQVYPNEMMAIRAEPPAFELFCFRNTIEPVRAVDHRGMDVTPALRQIDRAYAGATELDKRFVGFAQDHFVELDFGERLRGLPADGRLVLFLFGWVEYPYSSTNFAAWQAGVQLRAPTLEVRRDGRWVELFREVGYPAGLEHVMTLDVTGKIVPSDRHIRISTNMELYWDRIFLALVSEGSGLTVTTAPVESADLHYLGYPREYSPDGRHPNLYDYRNIDRSGPWKLMPGDYTRFGEVAELLTDADDRYVIMGRGEELTLKFDVAAFGPVPGGCRRTFILKTDSFCKDMDLYTAWPDTVEPLPFHGMSGYPYGPEEKYPDDESVRRYQAEYNTRTVHPTGTD